jgi:hypothetical protein
VYRKRSKRLPTISVLGSAALGHSGRGSLLPLQEKCLHVSPGDILIDDWEKYRDLWAAKGGVNGIGGVLGYARAYLR